MKRNMDLSDTPTTSETEASSLSGDAVVAGQKKSRFVIEGEWSGYRSSQQRVVHRQVYPAARKALRAWAEATHAIYYTDGTALYLAVRDCKPRERVKEQRGYTSLIEDCAHYKVNSVAALHAAKRAASSGPEGRAEGQSPAVGNVDHSNETVSSRAESETASDDDRPATPEEMSAAIRAISATAQRLMGERDALAGALRALTSMADRYSDSDAYLGAAMKRARAVLAQLDSVAPPLTTND